MPLEHSLNLSASHLSEHTSLPITYSNGVACILNKLTYTEYSLPLGFITFPPRSYTSNGTALLHLHFSLSADDLLASFGTLIFNILASALFSSSTSFTTFHPIKEPSSGQKRGSSGSNTQFEKRAILYVSNDEQSSESVA